tara:strand:- start:18433 stop:24132 length:5700 start_codon:yes stop_codon:yes gene_type:complete
MKFGTDFKQLEKIFLGVFIFTLGLIINVNGQVVTGVDTLSKVSGVWEYYDFTSSKAFTIADTATYTPDIWGSSNEGVNFGKEYSSFIPGKRLYLLGTGNIDTVKSVPTWTDAAPWVDTSWDFTNGTQGSPISVGQLWAVYTSEGLYAVMQIDELPGGSSGDSFVFKFKYMSEGGTTLVETNLNENEQMAEIQISDVSTETGFTFSSVDASSKTSATDTYQVTGVNLEGDIEVESIALVGTHPGFDLSITGSSFSGTVTIPMADATNKEVTVRAIVPANNGRTYNGKITHTTTNGEVVEVPVSVTELYQDASITISEPIDGSTKTIGSDITFDWSVSNLVNEQLTLEYSLDETNWADITTKLSGLGTYVFNTEGLSAGSYYLRISAKNLPTPISSNTVSVTLEEVPAGEMISGSTTSTSGTGFDFSREETADNNDAGDYQLDFAFVNNEGVNFGNEGSTSLNGTGRRFLLLGTGNIDTVKTVPVRTDAAPWVTVSYDFADGTQGQPISVGQLWGVFTREGHYAVMEITALPGGNFGSSFDFKYKYQPNGTRFFEGGNVVEETLFISTNGGVDQTVTINTTLSENLVAAVRDESDTGVSGKTVLFRFLEVPEGATGFGGLISSVVSDINGNAETGATVGNVPGNYVVKASLQSDTTEFVTFTINVEEPSGPQPTTLVIAGGQNQITLLGDTIATSLEIVVIDDIGEPMNGITVTFEEMGIPDGAVSGKFFTPDGININKAATFNNRAYMDYSLGDTPGDYLIKAFLADYPSVDSVVFTISGELLKSPAGQPASGPGVVTLYLIAAKGAVSYNIYRSQGDDNPASASFLVSTTDLIYEDKAVTPGETYFYWLKSVDRFGNESETAFGPLTVTPTEVPDKISGTATVIIDEGWQYFDFSTQSVSNQEQNGSFIADFRGTSNEGVNFGREGATTIEGNRIILLSGDGLSSVVEIPVWTNEAPWIGTSWEWPNGTSGQPISVGQLWGVYTSEGHYAAMEITEVPEAFGSSFSFNYIYQPDGTNIFGEVVPLNPDSLLIVSGNNQTGNPNTTLSQPLMVQVVDESGTPVEGVTVNFNITKLPIGAMGGGLSASSAITTTEGVARVTLTLSDKLGDYEVTATVESLDPVIFTALAIETPAPDPVTMLEIRDGFSSNSLIPQWNQSKSDNFLMYRLYMKNSDGDFMKIDSTRVGASFRQDTSKVVNGLTDLQEYTFAVSVVNSDLKESVLSNSLTSFPKPIPDAPQNFMAVAGDGAVQLSWSPVDTMFFDYYELFVREKAGFLVSQDTLFNALDSSFVVGNLSNEIEYTFVLNAVNIYGKGGESVFADAAPGSTFEEETTTLPSLINGTSIWADVENDGDLDFLITGQVDENSEPESYLFLNDGTGNFIDSQNDIIGVINSSGYWYDIDQNGYIDLIISGENSDGAVTKVYLNEEGSLTDAGFTLPGLGDGMVAPGDFDSDGDLDFLIAGDAGNGPQTLLIENTGNGTFVPVEFPFIGFTKAASAWGDYNSDGRLDFLISGETTDGFITSILYRNSGNRTFVASEASLQGVINGTVSLTDLDLDGDLDVIVTGFTNVEQTASFTGLYTNTGIDFDLFYSATNPPSKVVAIASKKKKLVVGDYDNDGDPDMLISAVGQASILKNNRGTIEEQTLNVGTNGTVTWADYDGDGDLDIIATGSGSEGSSSKIIKNTTQIRNTAPSIPSQVFVEVRSDSVLLRWSPSTDLQTPSTSLTYNVRIGTTPGGSEILSSNADLATGKLRTQRNGNAGYKVEFLLQNLPNGMYYWQVQAIDNGFMSSMFTEETMFEVLNSAVANEISNELPKEFTLNQNYPNPFNPSTNIEYSTPKSGLVRLQIFDITGRLISSLVNETKQAGTYQVTFDAGNLASGLYIYRLQVANIVITKKMTLVK